MSEEKCKFYKKQFLNKYCELFKQPCYGKHCNFIKEFTKLNELEQQLQTAKEENETLTQQNKQLKEFIENLYTIADDGQNVIKKHNDYNGKIYGLGYLQDIKDRIYNAQQALKGVE